MDTEIAERYRDFNSTIPEANIYKIDVILCWALSIPVLATREKKLDRF